MAEKSEHKQGMLNPLLGWPQYIEMKQI